MDDLPRKLKKKEASKTPAIMKWFLENYPYDVAVEVKVGKNKVKDHQQTALTQIQEGRFSWKIPDMGRRNPFDFMVFKGGVHPVVVHEILGNYFMGFDMITGETINIYI